MEDVDITCSHPYHQILYRVSDRMMDVCLRFYLCKVLYINGTCRCITGERDKYVYKLLEISVLLRPDWGMFLAHLYQRTTKPS